VHEDREIQFIPPATATRRHVSIATWLRYRTSATTEPTARKNWTVDMIMVRSHAGSTHSGSNCSASDIARSINDMIITFNPAMRLQSL
jgi:hypothetical protein